MERTLEHAIGQKLMISFTGYDLPPEVPPLLRERHVGGVCLFRAYNVLNPGQVRRLTGELQSAAARAGLPPLLIAADQEGGQLLAIGNGATPFPGNLALGAAGSPDLARRAGKAIGSELAAMGINVNFAPVSDVNLNPNNPAVDTRSFGEAPPAVADLSAALIWGLQSAGVAATAKHFPGHGSANGDSHYGPALVDHDREHLNQVELPPFLAAIEADVQLIMTAHVAFRAVNDELELPATLSPALLRGLLRNELGFRGLIVSDALNMAAIAQGDGLVVDAIAAVQAGVDVLLLQHDLQMQQRVYHGLLHAAQRGMLQKQELAESVERVLRLKRWLGDWPQPPLDIVGCGEHQRLAQRIAASSVTLVRDEARLLPLALASDHRLAVVAPQPIDLTPADTSSYETCSLAQVFRRYHPCVDEFVVPQQPTEDEIAAIQQRVVDYDLTIVGTINATMEPQQAALVNAVLAAGVPTIAVALRMPGDLQVYPTAPTYVCTYSIQPPSLEALVQALLGQQPFVGRLPVSIAGLYPLGYRLESSQSYQLR